mgnify:CR=1 FL=1
MNRIDRPALRVSSHQRRAAALAEFVRRYRSNAQSIAETLDTTLVDRLSRDSEEQD